MCVFVCVRERERERTRDRETGRRLERSGGHPPRAHSDEPGGLRIGRDPPVDHERVDDSWFGVRVQVLGYGVWGMEYIVRLLTSSPSPGLT